MASGKFIYNIKLHFLTNFVYIIQYNFHAALVTIIIEVWNEQLWFLEMLQWILVTQISS